MKNKKSIMKILIISVFMILVCCQTAYCVEDPSTIRMEIVSDGTTWNKISVSDSYKECEYLNSVSSTLGTAALEAHLVTDYDWSIMAIFSASQYGGVTTNKPTTTNGNDSGIKDVNGSYSIQTTSVLNGSNSTSTAFLYGLYNADGSLKKYVNKITPSTGKDQLGRTAIGYIADGGTFAWLGALASKGTYATYPVSIKKGLFDIYIGPCVGCGSANNGTSGAPFDSVTFRPVIWN